MGEWQSPLSEDKSGQRQEPLNGSELGHPTNHCVDDHHKENQMNRITAAVSRAKAMIEKKGLPQSQLDTLNNTLNMGLDEYSVLQNRKSLASCDGTLSLEEAQTVYMYLGESVDTFNNQPLEVKIVLTQLLQELLGRRAA